MTVIGETAPTDEEKAEKLDPVSTGSAPSAGGAVFIDFDTVLLATHQGRRGLELGLQADLPEALERLGVVASSTVILVAPTPRENGHGRETARRLELLRERIGAQVDGLIIVTCPHGEDGSCDCSKPGHGLIEAAVTGHGLSVRGGWYIGADADGMQSGRAMGLRTIRIGPVGEDHLSAVHRADYEARDLLDAANRIMLEELALP